MTGPDAVRWIKDLVGCERKKGPRERFFRKEQPCDSFINRHQISSFRKYICLEGLEID